MDARLKSLLVAGGVTLIGLHAGPHAMASVTANSSLRTAVLQGATLEPGEGMDVTLTFDVPAFDGTPRLQVLSQPNRIVVDLPGVIRGTALKKQDLIGWKGGLIQKARLAQFASVPAPITRLVLEVADGTQGLVTKKGDAVQILLQAGMGTTQARLISAPAPVEVLQVSTNEQVSAPVAQPVIDGAPALPPAGPAVSNAVVVPAKPALEAIPSLSLANASIPAIGIANLLPATVTAIQEKAPSTVVGGKEDLRGRTLGDSRGRYSGSRITIDVKGAELSTFLRIIADHAKLNLVADQDVQGIYDFKFTETPWDQVLDIIVKHAGLGMEINNGVIRVAKMEKLQKEEDDRKKLEESKALAGDLTTVTRPLSFAKAAEVKPIVEKMLSKRGSLIIDDRTNVLIISDLAKTLPVIDDLIQQLDVQIQQVQIEARVVEASGSYEKAFGVQWPSSNSGSKALQVGGQDAVWSTYGRAPSWNSTGGFHRNASNQSAGGAWTANNGIENPAGELWVSFLSNKFSVNVILQALEKDGKIKIVSNPKVVTQNNKKATVLSGAKIPYPTQQSGSTSGAITVSFADANLQLDVTPQITNDGTIIMDLKIEKAEPDFSAAVNGTPSIIRKYVETQVLVRDGGTAVLGGVYTTTTNAQTQGIPFLKNIPIIGWLFRSKVNKENNSELLIFITPRILKL